MPDKRFCVVITSALALVAFVFVMRFLPDFATWSDWRVCGDQNACSIQGWLAATSGWAGFVVAVVTGYFIFGQMREARHQRQFAIGDTLPTVQMAENVKETGIVQIRVVNWNRRQLILDRIEVANAFEKASISRITFAHNRTDEPWSRTDPNDTVIRPSVSLRGWEHRGIQPPYLKIACRVVAPSNVLQLRLHCRQISDKAKVLVLEASCELTDESSRSPHAAKPLRSSAFT